MKGSKKKILLATLFCTIAFLVIIYLGISVYYQYHFLPGTMINGHDCGNKTVSGVEEELLDNVRTYHLTIEERLGQIEMIPSADIEMELSIKGDLKSILDSQNAYAWFKEGGEHNADIHVTYDEDKLDRVISKLACLDDEKIVGIVPATLEYSNGKFNIVDGHSGNEINKELAIKAIKNAIDNMDETLVLENTGCYLTPLQLDTSGYEELVKTLNSYLNVQIILTFGEDKEIIDKNLISGWVSIDESSNIVFNETAIREYLTTLADKYDTNGISRTFVNAEGKEITVSGGDYGWWLDGATECASIIADIKSLNSTTREPAFRQRADVFADVDFKDDYIEVNLAKQKLYAIKDGKLFHEADIVSGKPKYETPTGVYNMRFMFKNYELVRPSFTRTVKYWMVFYGNTVETNIGLCSCDWLTEFGGTVYKTSKGSLGSIYMSDEDAKIIYENYPNSNFAVVIYNK